MKFLYPLLIFFITNLSVLFANITEGIPFITHYSDKDYNVSNNNWDIVQDSRGIIYFANDYGILEYDGVDWNIIQVAINRSNIKSLAFNKEGRLFVGAQGDLGYLDYQQSYGLIFKSLINKIPKQYRDFEDVKEVIVSSDQVYFHTWNSIFKYANDTIVAFSTGNRIQGMFKVNERIVGYDSTSIFYVTNDGLERITGGRALLPSEIRFMLPYNGAILVGTHLKGLYLLAGEEAISFKIQEFTDVKLTCGLVRKNGDIAIGTSNKGIYFITNKGSISRHLSKETGIQNNEIRSIFSDQKNNLWVSSKTGIDMVELASPFSHIFPNPDEPQGVYSAAVFNSRLYFATHNGFLASEIKEEALLKPMAFNRMNDFPDINWNIKKVNNSIVVAHNKGFSQLINNKVFLIYNQDGGWMVTELPNHSGFLLGGTYSGLVLLKKDNGKLEFIKKFRGFDESCRVIEIDNNNNIWVAHGYRGIYRIRLKKDLSEIESISFYDNTKGLPTNIYNGVFKIWNEIVFGTQYGYYKYDPINDSIVINKELSDLLGYRHGRYLKEDPDGNIWFVVDDESGIIHKHADGTISVQKNPFLKLKEHHIPGFEHFHFLNSNTTLIGAKDGVILYHKNRQSVKKDVISTLLRKVTKIDSNEEIYNDRFEYLCDTAILQSYELKFKDNSLKFSFASSYFENIEDVQYQFFLQGYDKDWSEWKSVQYKDYTNLREGEYVFRVKSKNIHNTVSEEQTFSFEVLPPWYRSTVAYILYAFIILFLFYLFIKVRNLKVKKEKDQYIKEQSRLRELELAHFNEEKLQNELLVKNEELSGLAMKVIYKNEKLSELKEKLSSVMDLASDRVSKKLTNLLSFIDNELDDDNWDDFELRFDQAHNDFIKKLKAEFPDLTSKDLKICAYLRMNLSSKEIANLLNMTVRGVENARYRVRKRMNLDSNVNLTEWLLMRK